MNIREAIDILINKEYLDDWIYDVRSRAREDDDDFKGDSWDHPRVKRFAEVCQTMKNYLSSTKAEE